MKSKRKYSILESKTEKEYTIYLVNLDVVKLLIDGYKYKLLWIRFKNMIIDLYNVEDLINDSNIKRKLAYIIISNRMNDIDNIINEYRISYKYVF